MTRSNKAHWSRVAFLEQNSLMEKTAMMALKWKELTWPHKKSTSVSSLQTPSFLDTQVASPDVDRNLTPRIPALPITPATSGRASRASSVGPAWERTPLITDRALVQRIPASDESILFHFKAIGSKSSAIVPAAFSWLANKVQNPSVWFRVYLLNFDQMLCRGDDEEVESQ